MTTQEITDLCTPLLGKTVFRHDKQQKFESFRIATKQVNISLTDEIVSIEFEKLPEFIKELTENLPETGLSAGKPFDFSTSVISTSAKSIADMIKHNMEEIKKNPAYIPQAEAINNQIKSLIELGKTEVYMVNTAHSIGNK